MADFLTEQTLGAVFGGQDYNDNLDAIEAAFAALGPWIISGLTPAAGTGLSVDVASGAALFGGVRTVAAPFTISGLTDATTNHLYMDNTGAGTSNTTGTQPANTVKLGTATTAGGVVTAVSVAPSSGRQEYNFLKYGRRSTKQVSANYTITAEDHTVGVDTTAGNVTITMPTAASVPGQGFVVKKVAGGNNVVLDGNGTEPIDGALTQTITVLMASLSVRSLGTAALGWWIE